MGSPVRFGNEQRTGSRAGLLLFFFLLFFQNDFFAAQVTLAVFRNARLFGGVAAAYTAFRHGISPPSGLRVVEMFTCEAVHSAVGRFPGPNSEIPAGVQSGLLPC